MNNCSSNGLCVSPNNCECFDQYDGENCTEKVSVNLNSPVFSNESYSVVVSENRGKGFVILTVSANDSDHGRSGEISYSIEEASIANFFMISQISGEITVVADDVLDYENIPQKQFTFTIVARDDGIPTRNSEATVTVTVKDENDNCPVFKTLPGNYKIPLQILAEDDDHGDNGHIDYSITEETDPDRKFFITSTGTLLANSILQPGAYLLTILARDRGDPSCPRELTLTVYVDKIVSAVILPTSTFIKGTVSNEINYAETTNPMILQTTSILTKIINQQQSSLQSSTIHPQPHSTLNYASSIDLSPSTTRLSSSTVRLDVRILNIRFVDGYRDKTSSDYANLRFLLEKNLLDVFKKIAGFRRISEVDFDRGSVVGNIQAEFASENTQVSASSLARAVVQASDENGNLGELHFDKYFLSRQITPTTPSPTDEEDKEKGSIAYVGATAAIGTAGLVCVALAVCLVSI